MIDQSELCFGDVKFLEPVSKTIAIANTGQVRINQEVSHSDSDYSCV